MNAEKLWEYSEQADREMLRLNSPLEILTSEKDESDLYYKIPEIKEKFKLDESFSKKSDKFDLNSNKRSFSSSEANTSNA